jgi:predicted DNA-binding transcriptional regulator AlpA
LVTTHLVSASQRDERRAKIAHRIRRKIELFPFLPDDALIEIGVVSALIGRSPASIWRDVADGRLARPERVGARSTRWRVAGVRAALKGGVQ